MALLVWALDHVAVGMGVPVIAVVSDMVASEVALVLLVPAAKGVPVEQAVEAPVAAPLRVPLADAEPVAVAAPDALGVPVPERVGEGVPEEDGVTEGVSEGLGVALQEGAAVRPGCAQADGQGQARQVEAPSTGEYVPAGQGIGLVEERGQ